MIMYSLKHYHEPPKLTDLVKSSYSGLVAKVGSGSWVSPLIPIQVGVYQGDPLSVVIVNTVVNTMVDTLRTRRDLGYSFSPSQHPINLLQYVDDTCLIGNSPASCQHLINIMATWLSWSGMKVKTSKCASLALRALTGKKMDPMFSIGDQHIPNTPNGTKFLGLQNDVPSDQSTSRNTLVARLGALLQKVDACPLTRKQKLLMYKVEVCPRLTYMASNYRTVPHFMGGEALGSSCF